MTLPPCPWCEQPATSEAFNASWITSCFNEDCPVLPTVTGDTRAESEAIWSRRPHVRSDTRGSLTLTRRSEADAYYKILRTIARFPITDPQNMDAMNMRLIAEGAISLTSHPQCDATTAEVAFPRWWLEQIRDQLFALQLPSGHVGDWLFLFREQVADKLNKPAAPPESGVREAWRTDFENAPSPCIGWCTPPAGDVVRQIWHDPYRKGEWSAHGVTQTVKAWQPLPAIKQPVRETGECPHVKVPANLSNPCQLCGALGPWFDSGPWYDNGTCTIPSTERK